MGLQLVAMSLYIGEVCVSVCVCVCDCDYGVGESG